MILIVTQENAHRYGGIMPAMYRLRYQAFVERQSYDVPSFRGMEYDAYDNPATVYLIYRDLDGAVQGCTRLISTQYPYMIEQLWPESVDRIPLPKAPHLWEASRFCINKHLPQAERKRIHGMLVCALMEYGLRMHIPWMIGVMTRPIWRCVFTACGWPIEPLGKPLSLASGEQIITGKMPISPHHLEALRHHFHIEHDVLLAEEFTHEASQAA